MSVVGPARRSGAWIFDPAGPDDVLVRACQDLKAGRYSIANEALSTCADHDTRARRSELLAAVAARGDADAYWLKEQPDNPHAQLLAARTAVLRVKRASDSVRPALVPEAEALCRNAAQAAPADPTPWVALLVLRALDGRAARSQTLAEAWPAYAASRDIDPAAPWAESLATHLAGELPTEPSVDQLHYYRQRIYHVTSTLPDLLVPGPWDVLLEVWSRHPHSREACLRFLDSLTVGDAKVFAGLIRQISPPDSLLQTLPLSANLIDFRYRLENEGATLAEENLADQVWADPHLRNLAADLYEYWFLPRMPAKAPVEIAVYSLLAHALSMTRGEDPVDRTDRLAWRDRPDQQARRAADVIAAMRPYASTHPWSVTDPGHDGRQAFTAVADEFGIDP